MSDKRFDVYIVGLGGQGILTIGDLLAHAALTKDYKCNFYPTKGMSQRGGFVQGQLRIGHDSTGASLPPKGADLIVSMERSEALKGIRYIKDGADFLLFDSVWPTTQMLMGKADYPTLATVESRIRAAGANLITLNEDSLPVVDESKVRANMFILGSLLKNTKLNTLFDYDEIVQISADFFKKGAKSNLAALKAGYDAAVVRT